MKHLFKGTAVVLSVLLGLSACSIGLAPAWKSGERTSLSLSFSSLPPPAGRAIIQGGGWLYIQTGLYAGDSVLYGPYAVKAGETLSVLDIPAGVYPFLALVYADGIKPDAAPVVIASGSDPDAGFQTALLASIGDPSTFSARLLKDVQIVSGQANEIRTSLIPMTTIVYDGSYSATKVTYPYLTATGSEMARRFVRIDNVGAGVPAGTALKAVKLFVENVAGTAEFGRLDLFGGDGTLREASQTAAQILAPASSVNAVTARHDGGSRYYAYAEYSGTTVSIAQEFALETNLVAVSSNGSARISMDGAAWGGPYATGLSTCTAVAWGGNGLFVAVGTNGGNYGLATSKDGVNWTPGSLPTSPSTLLSVKANPAGQLVAIGNTGATNFSFTSTDGVSWTGPGSVPYTSTNPVWLAGNWYITNSNGSTWLSSPDGVTWSAVAGTGAGMYQLNALGAVNGYLVAGGGAPTNTNKQVQVSSNLGVSFGSLIPVNTAGDYITAFATTGTNRLISVGSGSAKQINYSDDNGATWTFASTALTAAVQAVCSTPFGIFVGGAEATLHRSTDNGATFALAGPASAAVTGIACRTLP